MTHVVGAPGRFRSADAELVSLWIVHHHEVPGILGIVVMRAPLYCRAQPDQFSDLGLHDLDPLLNGQSVISSGRVEVEVDTVLAFLRFRHLLEPKRGTKAIWIEESFVKGSVAAESRAIMRVPRRVGLARRNSLVTECACPKRGELRWVYGVDGQLPEHQNSTLPPPRQNTRPDQESPDPVRLARERRVARLALPVPARPGW